MGDSSEGNQSPNSDINKSVNPENPFVDEVYKKYSAAAQEASKSDDKNPFNVDKPIFIQGDELVIPEPTKDAIEYANSLKQQGQQAQESNSDEDQSVTSSQQFDDEESVVSAKSDYNFVDGLQREFDEILLHAKGELNKLLSPDASANHQENQSVASSTNSKSQIESDDGYPHLEDFWGNNPHDEISAKPSTSDSDIVLAEDASASQYSNFKGNDDDSIDTLEDVFGIKRIEEVKSSVTSQATDQAKEQSKSAADLSKKFEELKKQQDSLNKTPNSSLTAVNVEKAEETHTPDPLLTPEEEEEQYRKDFLEGNLQTTFNSDGKPNIIELVDEGINDKQQLQLQRSGSDSSENPNEEKSTESENDVVFDQTFIVPGDDFSIHSGSSEEESEEESKKEELLTLPNNSDGKLSVIQEEEQSTRSVNSQQEGEQSSIKSDSTVKISNIVQSDAITSADLIQGNQPASDDDEVGSTRSNNLPKRRRFRPRKNLRNLGRKFGNIFGRNKSALPDNSSDQQVPSSDASAAVLEQPLGEGTVVVQTLPPSNVADSEEDANEQKVLSQLVELRANLPITVEEGTEEQGVSSSSSSLDFKPNWPNDPYYKDSGEFSNSNNSEEDGISSTNSAPLVGNEDYMAYNSGEKLVDPGFNSSSDDSSANEEREEASIASSASSENDKEVVVVDENDSHLAGSSEDIDGDSIVTLEDQGEISELSQRILNLGNKEELKQHFNSLKADTESGTLELPSLKGTYSDSVSLYSQSSSSKNTSSSSVSSLDSDEGEPKIQESYEDNNSVTSSEHKLDSSVANGQNKPTEFLQTIPVAERESRKEVQDNDTSASAINTSDKVLKIRAGILEKHSPTAKTLYGKGRNTSNPSGQKANNKSRGQEELSSANSAGESTDEILRMENLFANAELASDNFVKSGIKAGTINSEGNSITSESRKLRVERLKRERNLLKKDNNSNRKRNSMSL